MSTAKNLSQVAGEHTDSSGQAPSSEQIQPWKRQPGESPLWFRRFQLYKGLGPKRSLVAALGEERAKIKVLESTETSEKTAAPVPVSKKRGKSDTKAPPVQEVPKPPPVQVPGSWKQASIKWRWVERASAWDDHMIDVAVDGLLEDFMDGAASSFNRVRTLCSMLNGIGKIFNENNAHMTYEQDCMYAARMQSIMRDIREEMRTFDEAVARAILRRTAEKHWKGVDIEKWEAKINTMSEKERADLRQKIDQEQARRRANRNG